MPWAGDVTELIESASPSGSESFARTLTLTAFSCWVVAEMSTAVGGLFGGGGGAGVTVTLTFAVALPPCPSETV